MVKRAPIAVPKGTFPFSIGDMDSDPNQWKCPECGGRVHQMYDEDSEGGLYAVGFFSCSECPYTYDEEDDA